MYDSLYTACSSDESPDPDQTPKPLKHSAQNPHDPLSYLSAWLALVPQALCVIYVTLIWASREVEILLMFAGQMACEVFNFLLKRLIKAERPKREIEKPPIMTIWVNTKNRGQRYMAKVMECHRRMLNLSPSSPSPSACSCSCDIFPARRQRIRLLPSASDSCSHSSPAYVQRPLLSVVYI
jgi:hypothetical protein